MPKRERKNFNRDYRDIIANLVDTYYFSDTEGIIREVSYSGAKTLG